MEKLIIKRTATRPAENYKVIPDKPGFQEIGSICTTVYIPPTKENALLLALAPELLSQLRALAVQIEDSSVLILPPSVKKVLHALKVVEL